MRKNALSALRSHLFTNQNYTIDLFFLDLWDKYQTFHLLCHSGITKVIGHCFEKLRLHQWGKIHKHRYTVFFYFYFFNYKTTTELQKRNKLFLPIKCKNVCIGEVIFEMNIPPLLYPPPPLLLFTYSSFFWLCHKFVSAKYGTCSVPSQEFEKIPTQYLGLISYVI